MAPNSSNQTQQASVGRTSTLRAAASKIASAAWVLLLGLTLLVSASAQAAPSWLDPQLQPSTLVPKSNLAPTAAPDVAIISVERAARIARRETGGRVLSTTRALRAGQPGVEVRLLINGARVTKVFVDGDGEVLSR